MGSAKRNDARRDANERGIVDIAEQMGATVTRLSQKGVPDLLVGYCHCTLLIEVKMPKGKLTPEQVTWHEDWRGAKPYIVRSEQDMIDLLIRTRALANANAASEAA